MNMNSQCLWEKGGSVETNPISVVLQQVSSHKKETLFACVCEGFGNEKESATWSGYFTERLVEWFHKRYLKKLLEKGREKEITKALEEELEKITRELRQYAKKSGAAEIRYSGILVQNSQCWIINRGENSLFLFNRRYNKTFVRPIVFDSEKSVWEGRIQKNVGVLLCSESFCKVFAKEEVLEVLFGDKKYSEESMKKRLKELWREGEKRGLQKAGGVLIRTY